MFLIDWGRAPGWLIQGSTVLALVVIAAAVASSGGAMSPAWIYLFFVAVFAAYFYRRTVAIAYLLACAAVHSLPLVYDGRSAHDAFFAQFAIAGPAYLVLGGAIIAGKRLMWELQARAEQLAAEQVSLRRVATAVVGGESAERIYELVAREAAALIGGGAAGILRLEHDSEAIVMGSWADREGGRYEPGRAITDHSRRRRRSGAAHEPSGAHRPASSRTARWSSSATSRASSPRSTSPAGSGA